mgnify:CR=1 FL=1
MATILGFMMTACSLNEEIYDTATPQSAILSRDDVDNALAGAYSSLNSILLFGRNALWSMYGYSDELYSTVGGPPGVISKKVDLNSGFGPFNGIWSQFYQGISNANAIMDYVDLLDLNPEYEAKAVAEAKFLRGLYHFYLVQSYGGVPIMTEVVDANSDFYPARNTVDEVYAQIFKDFADAAESLPLRPEQPSSETGRATKGSALGFLAKANLVYANYLDLHGGNSTEYYTNAIEYSNQVIASGEFQLVDDFDQLWEVSQEAANAVEIVFAVKNTRDPSDFSNSGEGSFIPFLFAPNNRPNSIGSPNGMGSGLFRVQPWVMEKYTQGDYENDYRTESSFLIEWQDQQNRTHTVFPFIPSQIAEGQSYISKYFDPDGLSNFGHENDLYLMRYSEIFLIKAEAENELNGPTQVALDAFNVIRERARRADGTPRQMPMDLTLAEVRSKEDMRLKIFDERGLELVAEYNRWLDMIRMRYVDNTRTMYEYQIDEFLPSLITGLPRYVNGQWTNGRVHPSSVFPYEPKYLLWPIPANQTSINPNLEQNPGW